MSNISSNLRSQTKKINRNKMKNKNKINKVYFFKILTERTSEK